MRSVSLTRQLAMLVSVVAAGYWGAHALGGLDEADVALDRIGADAVDADALALRDGTQRDEVAGRRGIGLDVDTAG